MPDRYTDYEKRPDQGGYTNTPGRGYAADGQPTRQRPAANTGRAAQGSASRPAAAGQSRPRPAQSAQRSASAGGQARPIAPNPMQRERPVQPRQAAPGQGYEARAARPAAGTAPARNYAQGQGRPGSQATAQRTGSAQPRSGAARPAAGTAQGRGYAPQGTQQRRPGQYGSAQPAKRPQGARPQSRPPQKRPAQSSGYGYSGASNGGNGGMPPVIRMICGVLLVALLITICLAITSKIRERDPQPVISQGTDMPSGTAQTQQTQEPTEAPTQEPTGEPTATPTEEPVQAAGKSVRIRAIGDVIMDNTMLENAELSDEVYDFSPVFELVGDVMADADLTMINIEATLRRGKYGYVGYPQFSTPHSILEDLKEVGVDMLTMCNNHALDGYYDGLKMSLDYADEAGMLHVGAYRTQAEHDTPEVYDIGGIRVGMVNYTQYTNSMEQYCDPEATIYGMRLMSGADYEGDIAALEAAGAEFTIAIMHWGEEYERYPESSTESVARRLVAAGADLVIGGHPHVVQPAEYVTATQADGTENRALVIYSIGNFVSTHRHENKAYTDNGVILDFTLQENEAGEIELVNPNVIPVYMWQTEGGGAYEFRAVPSGQYLDNPPAGMSAGQYERMKQSWNEIVELMGGVIPVVAD